MAVKNHPSIKIAEAQWEAAVAQWEAATDAYYPTITGSVAFRYSEAQSAAVGGSQLVRTGGVRQYSLGVNANQTLLDFGQTRNTVKSAEKSAEATQIAMESTLQDLLLNVATQYFSVLREQQSVTLNEDNVRNAEAQLARARGFYEAGTRAKIEVTRAEADLANAQLALIQAQNSEKKARASLNTAMGSPVLSPFSLRDVAVASPQLSQEKALERADQHRPDLKSQEARVKAAEYNLYRNQLAYWPTISASAGYSWAEQFFLPSPYNWNVGVSLNVPIFNEPLLSANIDQANANVKQATFQLEQVRLTARQEVVEAWLAVREAEQRCRTSLAGLASAQENFRLASERYQVGVGASLDVSDAQRLLIQARAQELQARYDLQSAIIRLHRTMGELNVDLLLSAYPAGDMPGQSSSTPAAPKQDFTINATRSLPLPPPSGGAPASPAVSAPSATPSPSASPPPGLDATP